MLIFRQLFDPASSTCTHLPGDGACGESLLIDPVDEHERRDRAPIAGGMLRWRAEGLPTTPAASA